MIRKFVLCLLIQLVAWCAIGQQNYKNIYEKIKTMKDYEAFQILFAYQSATTSKDFVNVNGYYQMGLIMQRMMRQYDPFLQPQNTRQCISDTRTYLSLALHYLTDKEVKSNGNYYQDSPKPLNLNNIKTDMEKRIKDVEEYDKYFEQNNLFLTRGTLKYNTCIETFAQINAQNSRLNDLYFLADNALKENLNILQINFDSTLYYIKKLKTSLEEYPMADYKVNYSLSPVSVYRLHGLVAANFIGQEVRLWDFTSWVNSFKDVLNADIAFLYKKADEEYKTNSNYISGLKRSQIPDNLTADYAVNPIVINKIYKYDFNSAVAPLLSYQEEKIRFLYHDVNNFVDLRLSETNNVAKSNSYYYDLIKKKQLMDDALKLTAAKVSPEAIKKYNDFFTANYKGAGGFDTYLKEEAKENDELLKKSLDTYRKNVWGILTPDQSRVIPYSNNSLHTTVILPDSVKSEGYFIHSKSALPSKKVFISGSYSTSESTVAFAALLNEVSDVEWLKILGKASDKSYGVLTSEADNGFATVVTAVNGTEIVNSMYLLDINGNVKKNIKLASSTIPRKLMYDDISQTFLLAFKGNTFMPYIISKDVLQLYKLNADLSTSWQKDLPFNGYISNVIKTNDRFYVYGAYSSITDVDKTLATGDDKIINAFVYTVNSSGERLSLKTFDKPFSYYPLWASKISNEYVDIISARAADNDAFYMILSTDNEVYYQN